MDIVLNFNHSCPNHSKTHYSLQSAGATMSDANTRDEPGASRTSKTNRPWLDRSKIVEAVKNGLQSQRRFAQEHKQITEDLGIPEKLVYVRTLFANPIQF